MWTNCLGEGDKGHLSTKFAWQNKHVNDSIKDRLESNKITLEWLYFLLSLYKYFLERHNKIDHHNDLGPETWLDSSRLQHQSQN